MERKYVDCREYPSDNKCSLAISADTENEILDVAIPHAVNAHGHKDTPELRDQVRKMIRTGVPA